MKKSVLYIFGIILCFFTVIPVIAQTTYKYNGKTYDFRMKYSSYCIRKGGKNIEAKKTPLIMYVSSAGYAAVTYGTHVQTIQFNPEDCYIKRSFFNMLTMENDPSEFALVGNNNSYLRIKENGYASFHYVTNNVDVEVFPNDHINSHSDAITVFKLVSNHLFAAGKGNAGLSYDTDNLVKDATKFAKVMSGGAPDKYLDDKSIASVASSKINIQNTSAGFKISGTIKNIIIKKSPFNGIQDLTKKNKVMNGCINSFGVILHHGKSGCSNTKYAVKDLQKICGMWKGTGTIIDMNMTNKEHYVFVAKVDGPDTPSNYRFGHNGLTKDMVNGFNQTMSLASPQVRSFSINDKCNWAIIGEGATIYNNDIIEDFYFAADANTMPVIFEAYKKYGKVLTVSMSETGTIVCCERGILLKDVPSPVYNALKSLPFKPYMVKFHDSGHYIITDGKGKCVTNL